MWRMKASLCPWWPWCEGFHSHRGFYPSKCHGGALPKESRAVPMVGKGIICFSLFFFAIHGETAFAAIQQLLKDGFSFVPGSWAPWAGRCSEVLEFPLVPLLGVCPGSHKQTPGQWWRHWCCNGRRTLKGNLSSTFQLLPQSVIHLRSSHAQPALHQNGTENLLVRGPRTKGFIPRLSEVPVKCGLSWFDVNKDAGARAKIPTETLCLEMELSPPPQIAHPASAANHITPHICPATNLQFSFPREMQWAFRPPKLSYINLKQEDIKILESDNFLPEQPQAG